MMRAILVCLLLAPLSVRAQEAPDYTAEDGLRLSLGAGLNLVGGADSELNDERIDDPPTSYTWLPTPTGVLRADLPVHANWLFGVQASVFAWDTTHEENLEYGNHLTFDVGALARVRFSFDRHRRSEVVASVAIGPSFDGVEPSLHRTGETIDSDVGLHIGGFLSYQLKPRSFPLGVFVDLGFTYHWLSQTTGYASGGRDEIEYFPLQTFVRVGPMFVIH